MRTDQRHARPVRGVLASLVVAAVIGGACATNGVPAPTGSSPTVGSNGAPSTVAATPSQRPPSSPRPSASASPPPSPGRSEPVDPAPPAATLAAEGGEPVEGQLGTYLWRDGGSDAPWLQGAPIRVGAGEPLAISLTPPISIDAWRVRMVPATADGPAGAVILGEGRGPSAGDAPAFDAPDVGRWTIEVAVTFADGLGSASYFWQLEAMP